MRCTYNYELFVVGVQHSCKAIHQGSESWSSTGFSGKRTIRTEIRRELRSHPSVSRHDVETKRLSHLKGKPCLELDHAASQASRHTSKGKRVGEVVITAEVGNRGQVQGVECVEEVRPKFQVGILAEQACCGQAELLCQTQVYLPEIGSRKRIPSDRGAAAGKRSGEAAVYSCPAVRKKRREVRIVGGVARASGCSGADTVDELRIARTADAGASVRTRTIWAVSVADRIVVSRAEGYRGPREPGMIGENATGNPPAESLPDPIITIPQDGQVPYTSDCEEVSNVIVCGPVVESLVGWVILLRAYLE